MVIELGFNGHFMGFNWLITVKFARGWLGNPLYLELLLPSGKLT